MGFLTVFAREMYLTCNVNQLQMKIKNITEQRMDLTETITQFTTQISDIADNDSPTVKKLKARMAELENLDKQLEMRMKKFQTQLDAANTELKATTESRQQLVQSSFSPKYC